MADKRMFSNKVIGSDSFLEMPDSTQNLYFHLSMYADDDGFVDKPKSIMRMTGKKEDDLKILIAKSFVIPFDSGVIVIKHWRLNNYIQKDRYKPTIYTEEKAQLIENENKEYDFCIQDVSKTDTQIRLDKNRLDSYSQQVDKNCTNEGNDFISQDKVDNESQTSPLDSAKKENIVITFILKDNTEFEITESFYNECEQAYPNIDVMQELRSLKMWCSTNPNRRKTRTGAKKFINSWLNRKAGQIQNNNRFVDNVRKKEEKKTEWVQDKNGVWMPKK